MSLMLKVPLSHCFTVSALEGFGVGIFHCLTVSLFHCFVSFISFISSFGIEDSNLFTFGQNFRKSFFAGSSHAILIISSNCLRHSSFFHTRITSGQLFSILIV